MASFFFFFGTSGLYSSDGETETGKRAERENGEDMLQRVAQYYSLCIWANCPNHCATGAALFFFFLFFLDK